MVGLNVMFLLKKIRCYTGLKVTHSIREILTSMHLCNFECKDTLVIEMQAHSTKKTNAILDSKRPHV